MWPGGGRFRQLSPLRALPRDLVHRSEVESRRDAEAASPFVVGDGNRLLGDRVRNKQLSLTTVESEAVETNTS